MTEDELRLLIADLMAQEFDKNTREGLLPPNTDKDQVQFLFEFNTEAMFQIILSNPDLKAKLPNTPKTEIEGFLRRLIEESDRVTRDRLNMPYRI